jgi:hypothetical protein
MCNNKSIYIYMHHRRDIISINYIKTKETIINLLIKGLIRELVYIFNEEWAQSLKKKIL